MATVDVTVRGAGVFGLAIAFACLERGARVVVIDPAGPGAGASGGLVGALTPHTPDAWNDKKAFQFACLREAGRRWARVEAVSGIATGFARTGRLVPLADARAVTLARERESAAASTWGDAFRWQILGPGEAPAWAPVSATGQVLHETLSARIHPRRACRSLSEAIRMLGGLMRSEGDDSGSVVHATGWKGLQALSEALGQAVGGGVKGQAALLRHAAPAGAPQVFAGGLHIVPHDDETVAVGSTSERDFDDPGATDDRIDLLLENAFAAMPILHGAPVLERWAGVRPRARSRSPLLGRWPERPGHVVANGGFKIGFGVAWGVADIVADLVLEGRDAIPEAFRLETCLRGA